jgi:hypothetical protein
MGTSTKRPLRADGPWGSAVRAYRDSQGGRSPEGVPSPGEALHQALCAQAEQEHDGPGLRQAMRASGRRLVEALDGLMRRELSRTSLDPQSSIEERRLAFIRSFVEQVAGRGGTFADAAVRRAAVQAAEQLLEDDALRAAVDAGTSAVLPLARDLFCAVYRMFFGNTVEQYLTTVIAESTSAYLNAHVPVLPMIDPEGQIGEWIAQNLVPLLPTPCKAPSASGPALTALGRELVDETVDRALGLPAQNGGSS